MSGQERNLAEPIEPLTRRERDILALLAQGHTGPEIAQELTLAISSVKWHTQHLYSKLGVNSKKQAVARARELGLLGALPAPPAPPPTASPLALQPEPLKRQHNLPLQVTRFFGREREVDQIIERLGENRLVTLTGPGGVGKTRLSLRTAEAVLNDFADGVWLVELAPLSNPALIAQQIAASLGLRNNAGQPILETVTFYLRERQLLLVLDNCEHLLAACAPLADSLLRACPGLRLLASSREPLGIAGEAIFSVPSLSFPDPEHLPPIERFNDYIAVRLFRDRAQLVLPTYQVTAGNAASLARICQRLDGIPLAIELAAARARVLTVEQIATRLDDRFRLLTGGSRVGLERHQTLRATVDWSYQLLSALERELLQRLSIFSGGWTLEAAEAVCAEAGVPAEAILDLLTQLASKSLVAVDAQSGAARYSMLETIRQYAREKLLEQGGAESLRDRHLDYYLMLAREIEPKLKTGERLVRTRQLGTEQDNFRVALEWSLGETNPARADDGLRLACALRQFWHYYGFYAEGRSWLEKGLASAASAQSGVSEIRAQALYALAYVNQFQGNSASAALYEASIALYRQLEAADPRDLADALGHVAFDWGFGSPRSRAAIKEAVALCRALGPKGAWDLARVLHKEAALAEMDGDDQNARERAEESVALYRQSGDIWESGPGGVLANIAFRQGDYARARAIIIDGLRRTREAQDKFAIPQWLGGLANLDRVEGDYETATAHNHEGLTLARDMGLQQDMAWRLRNLGIAAVLRAEYEPARTLLLESLTLRRNTIATDTAGRAVDVGYNREVALSLAGLSEIGRAQGRAARALTLLQAAESLMRSVADEKWIVDAGSTADQIEYERLVASHREQIQDPALANPPGGDIALTVRQAIDLALEPVA